MSNYSKSTNFATKDSLASGNPLKVIKGTEIDDEFEAIETSIGTKADLASPTFTGTPAAPTATNAIDSTQIATTAFVKNVISAGGYVARAGIATDAIDGTKIADDSIDSEHYVDGSIDTAHLADSSVTSAKIANGTIVSADIATDTITASNIAANAIGASELADNAVDTNAIADGAVTLAKLASSALSNAYPVGSIYINASVSTNPATLLGFGTWVAFGAGRVLVGFDSGNTLFDAAEETGGSADATVVSHTHTATSTVTDPGHTHNIPSSPADEGGGNNVNEDSFHSGYEIITDSATTGITVATTIASAGSSGTNANYQPYITVYMWKRTA